MDAFGHPEAGVDYPETFEEFERCFPTEDACRAYLQKIRWGSEFCCPKCYQVSQPWLMGRGLYLCRLCRGQSSITAGTILQDFRKPLRTWFLVMWFVTGYKYGASALGLQRQLGFRSYQTAWIWLHKLRRAMVRPDRDLLSGTVEVDETFIGGVEPGGGGRHIGKKSLVAVATEVRGTAIGRIRLKIVEDGTAESLTGFICSSVTPGATVVTDGLASYGDLRMEGYRHRPRVISGSGQKPDKLLPRVHRVSSQLKRWLLGTHQGAVSKKHLEYYLDEFTFRFNRRTSKSRGLLFYRLLENAVSTRPAPYRSIVRGKRLHAIAVVESSG